MYGLCVLWLTACAALAKGCAVSTSVGISNCREIPCAASSRRSAVNWPVARRTAVGAASPNRRGSIHGETGKGDPFWGLKPQRTVWPNHGSFRTISRGFGAKSRYFQITVVCRLGGPETAPATGQAHPHSRRMRFREPKRLRSFGKLLKHPIPKDNVGYRSHRLLAMVSIGYRLWSTGAAVA